MTDYGKQKSLTEILQDLVLFCQNHTAEEVNIQITLPKNVLYQYSQTFRPFQLVGTTTLNDNVGKVHLHGGTVELKS